jgi:hypothetical protein
MGLQVSVIAAPKLEALGSLCELDVSSRLALGSVIIQVDLDLLLLAYMRLLRFFLCVQKNLKIWVNIMCSCSHAFQGDCLPLIGQHRCVL